LVNPVKVSGEVTEPLQPDGIVGYVGVVGPETTIHSVVPEPVAEKTIVAEVAPQARIIGLAVVKERPGALFHPIVLEAVLAGQPFVLEIVYLYVYVPDGVKFVTSVMFEEGDCITSPAAPAVFVQETVSLGLAGKSPVNTIDVLPSQ
jgi:hypothetical protein